MAKKQAKRTGGRVKADIYTRLVDDICTPGGKAYTPPNAPVDRLILGTSGFGWSREALADYLRRNFSIRPLLKRSRK